jgi:hypothetical protein
MHSQLFDNLTDNLNSGIDDEQKLLEQRLLEQQRQSEEDSRWLAREEVHHFASSKIINRNHINV